MEIAAVGGPICELEEAFSLLLAELEDSVEVAAVFEHLLPLPMPQISKPLALVLINHFLALPILWTGVLVVNTLPTDLTILEATFGQVERGYLQRNRRLEGPFFRRLHAAGCTSKSPHTSRRFANVTSRSRLGNTPATRPCKQLLKP